MNRPRQPLLNVPASVVVLLVLMAVVQLVRTLLSTETELAAILNFSFIPLRLTALTAPSATAARVASWIGAADADTAQRGALAEAWLNTGRLWVGTLLSYAFLHGNWSHLGLNSVWLLAFGSPVARRFGTARFLIFFVLCAVAGALAHWACFPFGVEPVVGASAAVSGAMGAAVRFAFGSRVSSRKDLLPFGAQTRLSLLGVFREKRALSFVVVWFISNALFGIGSSAFGLTTEPVAWQAHIGGFVAGLLLFGFFDPAKGDLRQAVSARDEAEHDDRT